DTPGACRVKARQTRPDRPVRGRPPALLPTGEHCDPYGAWRSDMARAVSDLLAGPAFQPALRSGGSCGRISERAVDELAVNDRPDCPASCASLNFSNAVGSGWRTRPSSDISVVRTSDWPAT